MKSIQLDLKKPVLDVMPKGSDKGTAIEWFSKNYLNNEKIYDYSLMFGDALQMIFLHLKKLHIHAH